MKELLKSFIIVAGLAGSCLFAQTLKVGTNANFPPFEYIDESSQIVGFDIDLINELAKRSGYEVNVIPMGFDGLIPALKSGKIDMAISGMSATEERKKTIDFSNVYFTTENLYLAKKDKDIKFEEIKDKKVGAQLGTLQEIRAKELTSKTSIAEDPFALIMALKSGKIDVVILDSAVAYGYIKKNPDLKEFYKESDGSDGFAIAYDKGKISDIREKFDQNLEAMKKDGSYDKLLEKYELK